MSEKNTLTIPDVFIDRVAKSGTKRAFQFPDGDGWAHLTWQQSFDRVRNIAGGLMSLELNREDRIAILSSTRIDWILADLGILCAGGATTTVYPSNLPEECRYIFTDSETTIAFAEDDGQVAKLVEERDNLPNLKKVITFEGKAGHDGWVITLAELEELGAKYNEENADAFDESVKAGDAHDLSTLIYTSGTTGQPKGVELTHDCWVFEGQAIHETGMIREDDHQYLWLPLSHSFGKVLLSSQLATGYLTTVDGRIPKLVENLGQVKPTFMAAAPRIFEKVYNKVVTGAQKTGGVKYKIFQWSVGVGEEVSKKLQARKQPTGLLAIKYKIATKLVFSKLQALFGGNIRFFISGSAPLSREMAEFFHAAGILILEGYGLTESSAASFVNVAHNFEFGTVGPPLGDLEVKIAESDGEILIRGRSIMRGYHNKPEITKETLTEDGWLLTGDIGELTDTGMLKITDRKKDLIKTSGGKYVAPQSLEGSLKAKCPYISQVLVHGNNRNYCTALISIDEESIKGWQEDNDLGTLNYEELSANDKVRTMLQTAVDALNSDLASYESIKKFGILPKDLSIEDGDLTPSLKVKRKVVETKYGEMLEGFYEGAMASI